MQKIKLTKAEKAIIRELNKKPIRKGDEYKPIEYIEALDSLEEKGLVTASVLSESKVLEAQLTKKGRIYIKSNPKLTNPIPWSSIFGCASIIAAAAGVAALFVGCIRLAAQVLQ